MRGNGSSIERLVAELDVLVPSYDCAMKIDDEVRPSAVRTWLIVWRRLRHARLIIARGQRRLANEDTARGFYLGPEDRERLPTRPYREMQSGSCHTTIRGRSRTAKDPPCLLPDY